MAATNVQDQFVHEHVRTILYERGGDIERPRRWRIPTVGQAGPRIGQVDSGAEREVDSSAWTGEVIGRTRTAFS
jgi:hypothetical protein